MKYYVCKSRENETLVKDVNVRLEDVDMGKWSLEKLRDNDQLHFDGFSVTCCGDCYLLACVGADSQKKERGYSIFKIINTSGEAAYIMFLHEGFPVHSNPPVLLTEDETLRFLNAPEEGKEFAFNMWLGRYR